MAIQLAGVTTSNVAVVTASGAVLVAGFDGASNFTIPLASGGGSVVVSGTVAIQSNASVNVAQINGVTPLMGNGITGTGSQRVTIASDNTAFSVNATLSAETTKVIGTVNVAASQTIAVTNTGTFATQSTLSAETTKVIGTARVLGNLGAAFDAATNAAPPANAVQVGFVAATALPSAFTATDLAPGMTDKFGRQVTVANTIRDLVGTASVNASAASGTSLVASGGAGVFTDIISLIITNETSTATIVSVTDGTVTYKYALAGNGGIVINFQTPLPATSSATAWTCGNSATVACDYVVVYAMNK